MTVFGPFLDYNADNNRYVNFIPMMLNPVHLCQKFLGIHFLTSELVYHVCLTGGRSIRVVSGLKTYSRSIADGWGIMLLRR